MCGGVYYMIDGQEVRLEETKVGQEVTALSHNLIARLDEESD